MNRPRSTSPSLPAWPVIAEIPRASINLDATLRSGQSFCWRRDEARVWHGWIANAPCQIVTEADAYRVYSPSASKKEVERYLGLDLDLNAIIASFPSDLWLAEATAFAPGLRLLAQEPWETLASFICSAVKQISQIEQINQAVRRDFGTPFDASKDLFAFPSPAALVHAGEAALRRCKLGFRAKNLVETARQLEAGEVNLNALHTLSTEAARTELIRLRGVGPKIADCVLLFAYRRADAFPIDVWVERVLRQLYFHRRRPTILRLRQFSQTYFGPHPGYAQQYLFHWVRMARPAQAFPAKKKVL